MHFWLSILSVSRSSAVCYIGVTVIVKVVPMGLEAIKAFTIPISGRDVTFNERCGSRERRLRSRAEIVVHGNESRKREPL